MVYVLPYIALLKIMIAALGFYTYLKYIGINKYSSLIVSLLYGYNGFIILWGQHYHMGTIIVFIPFVLLGFEKWVKEKKSSLYIISLFFVAFSSYYFLFMFAMFFIMYVIVRYFEIYKFQLKHFASFIVKIAMYSILAIGLSCFILLPSVYVALNNPRISGQFIDGEIFRLAGFVDYITMFFRLFSNDILGTGTNSMDCGITMNRQYCILEHCLFF
ncbi:YfhO family protein [Paenibacillus sp. D2_2]|uniref:YfhO family protein n=1 Tax=Paenibacillus sp. D2_2 TaxID=3073092 RepID=UPI0028151438|nr:YfhO family protein [Paenibacillus sp. D2_2]WMT40593.1 YfhO family protein [Paenibacillus sp. D2_2]